ncbi:MAG: OmpA family protein [Deltaproteobacteria bacterium]|nr:OmpA family protein [Deltaproteobacteria bacterium]
MGQLPASAEGAGAATPTLNLAEGGGGPAANDPAQLAKDIAALKSSPAKAIDLKELTRLVNEAIGIDTQTDGQGTGKVPAAIKAKMDEQQNTLEKAMVPGAAGSEGADGETHSKWGEIERIKGLCPGHWDLPIRLLPKAMDPDVVTIEFDQNEDMADLSALKKLEPFCNPRYSFKVVGYASAEGSEKLNWELSTRRAMRVALALEDMGAKNVKHHGEGESRSQSSEDPFFRDEDREGLRAEYRKVTVWTSMGG